jgi:hypothetical protein
LFSTNAFNRLIAAAQGDMQGTTITVSRITVPAMKAAKKSGND